MHSKIVKSEEIKLISKEILLRIDDYRRINTDFLPQMKVLRRSMKSELHEKIFDLICSHLFSAEKASPGGADFFMEFSLGKIPIAQQNNSRLFRKSDLSNVLRSYLDQELMTLAEDLFQISSFNSKILLKEDTHEKSTSILEKNDGFYFEGLRPSYHLRNMKLKDVRVCPIDGFIESVSEIHFLLEKISSLQEPCVFFVRGLSEDVTHTLKVNYERNRITCIPVVVSFDIEGANSLNDIAVISGCDVVSSFKGETINSIDIEKYPRIDSVTFLSSGISLENKNTNKRIQNHINFIIQKIEDSDSSASEQALARRLQRLVGGQITVSLSNDHKKKKFSFDKGLRAVQMSKAFGVLEYKDKTYPRSTIEAGNFFFKKFKDTMDEIGCIVV